METNTRKLGPAIRVVAASCLFGITVSGAGALPVTQALGERHVKKIKITEEKHVVVRIGKHTNPAGCTEDRDVLIAADALAHGQLLATALSAKSTRGLVTFEVRGCQSVGARTYPAVQAITWR